DVFVLLQLFLASEQADQPDDPVHVVWIRIPGGRLVNQFGLFNACLGGHRQHYSSNLIDRRDVEDQFGVSRQLALPLQGHKDDWGRGGEALVPTREWIVL